MVSRFLADLLLPLGMAGHERSPSPAGVLPPVCQVELDAAGVAHLLHDRRGRPKPRNPRHFDDIKGGRKRDSYIFTHKNSGS